VAHNNGGTIRGVPTEKGAVIDQKKLLWSRVTKAVHGQKAKLSNRPSVMCFLILLRGNRGHYQGNGGKIPNKHANRQGRGGYGKKFSRTEKPAVEQRNPMP